MKSVINLISSLTLATERGKLTWEDSGLNTLSANLPEGYRITVWKWVDENSDISGVSIKLTDKEGELVDSEDADQFTPSYLDLMNFYTLVRRRTHDVTSVIEHLEQDILNLT
jgi:hypothetical protein